VVVLPGRYEAQREWYRREPLFLIQGILERRDRQLNLVAEQVWPLTDALPDAVKSAAARRVHQALGEFEARRVITTPKGPFRTVGRCEVTGRKRAGRRAILPAWRRSREIRGACLAAVAVPRPRSRRAAGGGPSRSPEPAAEPGVWLPFLRQLPDGLPRVVSFQGRRLLEPGRLRGRGGVPRAACHRPPSPFSGRRG
jgi:hypothetical protein